MADPRLTATQAAVSVLLNEIADRFKPGAKLTLVVRNPAAESAGKDADFVLTNDTLDEAMAALQRRKDAR